MELFVGSYTSEQQRGNGLGISSLPLLADGLLGEPRLLAEAEDPSFLALSEDGLFAVQEREQGRLLSFQRRADAADSSVLELLGASAVAGTDPCHLTRLADGRVVVANYGSGSVALLGPSTHGTGRLELQDVVQFDGSGPVTERQAGPHAHQVLATPYGTLLVSDLGSDTVTEFRPTASGLELEAQLRLPAGAGPRHAALRRGDSTDWLLVLGELDGGLHVFTRSRREDSGGWRYAGSTPLATRASTGPSYPAHIELSADRGLAYVSVRGQDQLSVFDLTPLERDELPLLRQEQPSGGVWPRHFTLGPATVSRRLLYLANQFSDNIVVFQLNADGLIGAKLQEVSLGSPVCLLVG